MSASAGAEIEATDKEGRAPLHLAAEKGDCEVVDRLLAAKAAVEALDRFRRTPLHWAARYGHTATVDRLLAAGAAVDARDNNGHTPLYYAAIGGHPETAQRLLAAGARADAQDEYGETPWDWAKRRGQETRMAPVLCPDLHGLGKAQNKFVFSPADGDKSKTRRWTHPDQSHIAFALILLVVLFFRLWEGDGLVQCGRQYPFVASKCICGGTLPYICWISESFNALYPDPDMSARVIGQTYCWLVLILSSAYLLLVVFPDTLPHRWLFLHYGTAMVGMGVAILFQFILPWQCLLGTFTSYFIYYFSLTEFCISQGAARHLAYDWTFTPGVLEKPGSLVMVVIEWTLSFGAITVVVSYCLSEIFKQRAQISVMKSEIGELNEMRDVAAA
eukprot:g17871.t1